MSLQTKRVEDIFGLEGQALDEYDVEQAVAAGGFGVVYRARNRELGHTVALKVLKIPSQFSAAEREEFERKFKDEARTVANLNHPAVVKVLGYKVSSLPANVIAPWMALEWIEGDTLAEVLRARRGGAGLQPEVCLRLLEPVFSALALAHERGIAHRDIKPANLMIPRVAKSERGRASSIGVGFGSFTRVLDFGIAKIMDPDEQVETGETETISRLRAVSLQYAAPEQVSGKRTGPWTDVHALALVLTEMLTGQPPYQAADREALLFRILNPDRPTPARRDVDVGAWEPVLARALALKANERFANALEFYLALKAALPDAERGGAVEAPPPENPASPNGTETDTTLEDKGRRASTTSPLTADPSKSSRRSGSALRFVAVLLVLLAGAGFELVRRRSAPSLDSRNRPPAAPGEALRTRVPWPLHEDGGGLSERDLPAPLSPIVPADAAHATASEPRGRTSPTDAGLPLAAPPTHPIHTPPRPRLPRRRRPID